FVVRRAQVLPDQLTLAEVEWLEEAADRPLLAEHADLAALLAALAQHPLVAGLGMVDAAAGQLQLANQLAYLLPLDSAQKLQVLQCDEPLQRLERLRELLEQLQG